MRRNFELRKNIILGVVGLLLTADAAMTLYSIGMASSIGSPQQELAAQITEEKLLKADVGRAIAIQSEMPQIKKDCERFEGALPAASSGYSAISSELAELGHEAGLQISSLGFKAKELSGRGMTEVAVDATVTGDYKSVVRFLNGMQRSKNFYVVESLALASDAVARQGTHGAIKVDFHLKSYFKKAA
jgi:type IV pilus assembly protein PilO